MNVLCPFDSVSQNNLVAFGSKNQELAGLSSLDTAKGTGLDHQNLRVTKELLAEGGRRLVSILRQKSIQ